MKETMKGINIEGKKTRETKAGREGGEEDKDKSKDKVDYIGRHSQHGQGMRVGGMQASASANSHFAGAVYEPEGCPLHISSKTEEFYIAKSKFGS